MALTLATARHMAIHHNWAASTVSVSYLVQLQFGVYELFFDREGKITSTGNNGLPILDN